MSIEVQVQYAAGRRGLPGPIAIRQWAQRVLAKEPRSLELTVRIVGEEEGRRLNARWRNQKRATNVLAFPAGPLPIPVPRLLGDVVICAPVVEREARLQGKDYRAHWAHLVVHGILHLLGHDHVKEPETRRMQELESVLLNQLGFPNPYR